MTSSGNFLIGLCALVFAGQVALHAADPNEAEKRLRDSLRNTMLQLRSAEAERATLQTAQAESEEKIKAQMTELEKLKKGRIEDAKKAAAEKEAADKALTELETKVADRDKEVTRLNESLGKWKAAYQKVADLARVKEDERAKKSAEVVMLERRVLDQKMKNDEMYKVGIEILTRYEKYSLGAALLAREPFTGIMRVKLQNLAQDYQDKLAEEKIKPSDAQKAANAANSKAPSTDKGDPKVKP